MKKQIKTNRAAEAPQILSQAIESNGFVFLSGQIGVDENWKLIEGEIEQETKKTLKNIKTILQEAGLDMDNIVKSVIYVTDLANSPKINEIYSLYFDQPLPARETVEVKALPLGAGIEISVIASR